MTVPLLDWRKFDETAFRKAYCETGFARFYNIWNNEECATLQYWFDAVQSWFKTANNKHSYEATGDFMEGWVNKEKIYLSPFRRNDYKETFEIDDLVDINCIPYALYHPLIHALPIIAETGQHILKRFETLLGNNELANLHKPLNQHHIRVAYYPATPSRDNQLPCGEHKDYNSITLLFSPDKNKRLQIKDRSGVWHDIRYKPNSVVVNLGNIMQKWTNNYLKSAVHRVLESDADSFTTAYFMYPPKDYKLHQIWPQAQQEDYPMSVQQFLTLFDKTKQAIKAKHGS